MCIQINYRYKYNKIFIIQHQRCLGTLPAGSSAVSMLISCEIPNKHILASFSHLTICLGNKCNIAVKRAASTFPDLDQNQMFVLILSDGMYGMASYQDFPLFFKSNFSSSSSVESSKDLAAFLSPGIVSRQASHKAVFS